MILADEINRTPPKTQAAMLEAMQERKVTVGGQDYPLPDPFFVLATQNPVEQEGTYPLPEAQLDRFMFMVLVDYPSSEEEAQIMEHGHGERRGESRRGHVRGGYSGDTGDRAEDAGERACAGVCGEIGAGDSAEDGRNRWISVRSG